MTESGFLKAQSDNLPRIDAFMMTSYFASNSDFMSAEIKGVKAERYLYYICIHFILIYSIYNKYIIMQVRDEHEE